MFHARKALEEKLGRPVSQQRLAEDGGLDRLVVQAIESGRSKGSGSQAREGLARAFGVSVENLSAYLAGEYGPVGDVAARHFVRGAPPPSGHQTRLERLRGLADLLLLPVTAVVAFLDSSAETRERMRIDELPEAARRAAWAVVHIEGCTIEAAFRCAHAAVMDEYHPEALTADDWFRRVQTRVQEARPSSGTRPSERSLKISG